MAGASMAESEGNKVERCDSENENKRIKSGKEEEEDRISALPDFLIHDILSLLPAIDLVKTRVLSKWWKYQWNHAPVLNFVPNSGMSSDQFSNFIDRTLILHDCSKIDKFVIDLERFPRVDEFPDLDLWINFAVRKDVKELIVKFNDDLNQYYLPQFLFNYSSLVILELYCCYFTDIEYVNWGSLKSLCLDDCEMEDETINNLISGTPLLEYLELSRCSRFRELVIASKNLKTLIFDGVCPHCREIDISCPNLERLRISHGVSFRSLKLMNLPSSVYATLDFYFDMVLLEDEMSDDDYLRLVQQTLRQVQHVEKLEIERWMMEVGGIPKTMKKSWKICT